MNTPLAGGGPAATGQEIVVANLSKVFDGDVRALDDLELTIGAGEFFCLLGPSGCGKTTLLRTIAGLESATSGSITIGGRDVTRLAPGDRNLAMVFQDYALYPHMTVRDNVAYPLRVKKVAKATRHQRAEDAGAALSLAGLMDRRPGQLSGGQQQRVALARAVATTPAAFLFDEPLSNLDARLRLEARTFLKQLQRDLATTAIFVTHDQSEALALSDRMAVMEAGQIRQVGTPSELFHRPANLFVAGFIGSTPMNLLPGTPVAGSGGDQLRIGGDAGAVVDIGAARRRTTGDGAALDPEVELIYGLRPEYARIVTGAAANDERTVGETSQVTGTVAITENLGTEFLVTVDIGDAQLRATVAEGSEPEPGDTVTVAASPSRVLLYRADTGALL